MSWKNSNKPKNQIKLNLKTNFKNQKNKLQKKSHCKISDKQKIK